MSIFAMEQVNTVMLMDAPDARRFIEDVIKADTTAKPITKTKARNQILRHGNDSVKMATAMSNWILAHPDEGLKVI